MADDKRVVLAYSGGVDTTACIPYLREFYGCSYIVAMAVDLGQGDELEGLRVKALKAGADESVVVDRTRDFVETLGFAAVRANALYDGQYPLSSALGRPLIGECLAELAERYDCGSVAHGATGKGNDQVRMDLSVALKRPDLKILAPAREWSFTRAETIEYSTSRGIPQHVSPERPWAVDLNVLGRNVEAGLIEDLSWEPTEEVWALTRNPNEAPEEGELIEIGFERGLPVSLDGVDLPAVELVRQLNVRAGRHGVGRIDMIENRVVGLRSRELYEAPAMVSLIRAHQELEQLTLTSDVLRVKRNLESTYAETVYNGLWHGPLRRNLDAFFESTQTNTSGFITLRLRRGAITVAARKVPRSMYRHELSTYGVGNVFDQSSAEGFIDIFGLEPRTWASVYGK